MMSVMPRYCLFTAALLAAPACGHTVQEKLVATVSHHAAVFEKCEAISHPSEARLIFAPELSLGSSRDVVHQLAALLLGDTTLNGSSDSGSLLSQLSEAELDVLKEIDGKPGRCAADPKPGALEPDEALDAAASKYCAALKKAHDSLKTLVNSRRSALASVFTTEVCADAPLPSVDDWSKRSLGPADRWTAKILPESALACGRALREKFEHMTAPAELASPPAEDFAALEAASIDLAAVLAELGRTKAQMPTSKISRLGQKLGGVLRTFRGAYGFFQHSEATWRALAARNFDDLARAVVDRGIFDDPARRMLKALEPSLRSLDRLLDRLDNATYGLVTVAEVSSHSEIVSAMAKHAESLVAELSKRDIPVMSFARAACERLDAGDLAAGSRVIPILYETLILAAVQGTRTGAAQTKTPEQALGRLQAWVLADAAARSAAPPMASEHDVRMVAADIGGKLSDSLSTTTRPRMSVSDAILAASESAARSAASRFDALVGATSKDWVVNLGPLTVSVPPSNVPTSGPASPSSPTPPADAVLFQASKELTGAAEHLSSALQVFKEGVAAQTSLIATHLPGALSEACARIRRSGPRKHRSDPAYVECDLRNGEMYVEFGAAFEPGHWKSKPIANILLDIANTLKHLDLRPLTVDTYGYASNAGLKCDALKKRVGIEADPYAKVEDNQLSILPLGRPNGATFVGGDGGSVWTPVACETDANEALSRLRARWAADVLSGARLPGRLSIGTVEGFGTRGASVGDKDTYREVVIRIRMDAI
jgi:hypothetical protein